MVAQSPDEAVANGRGYDEYPPGQCQKFVRGPCWEAPSLYGSAEEAWAGAAEKHPGDRTPPYGAPVYYESDGPYGHAVLSVGNGRIRSTDCPTTGQVSETDIGWPERTWGQRYLGWTGDINGVDLPLGGEEDDMPLSDADLDKIAKRVWAHKVGEDAVSTGTIMVRVNPGPYGIASAIANAVWDFATTSAVDGSKQVALTILRWAHGDAHKAAGK